MNASFAGRDRLQRRGGVHDERIPARAGEDAHAVPGAAALVVDAERDRLARRRRARALLLDALVAAGVRAGENTQSKTNSVVAGGERRRIARRAPAVSGRSRKR